VSGVGEEVGGEGGLGGVGSVLFTLVEREDKKMPGGDRTGPMGMGPMTGRAAGYCAGNDMPGYINPIPGRGFWGRGGWGRGWRRGYYAAGFPSWAPYGAGMTPYQAYGGPYVPQPTPEQELEVLKGQAKYFQDALQDISKRIQELETAGQEEKK
jgi:hypothetical protein